MATKKTKKKNPVGRPPEKDRGELKSQTSIYPKIKELDLLTKSGVRQIAEDAITAAWLERQKTRTV